MILYGRCWGGMRGGELEEVEPGDGRGENWKEGDPQVWLRFPNTAGWMGNLDSTGWSYSVVVKFRIMLREFL